MFSFMSPEWPSACMERIWRFSIPFSLCILALVSTFSLSHLQMQSPSLPRSEAGSAGVSGSQVENSCLFQWPYDSRFFMFCQLYVSKIIPGSVLVLGQERVVSLVKGVYRIQQASKMVIERPAPDESITVRIRFYFRAVDIKLFECNEPFFL